MPVKIASVLLALALVLSPTSATVVADDHPSADTIFRDGFELGSVLLWTVATGVEEGGIPQLPQWCDDPVPGWCKNDPACVCFVYYDEQLECWDWQGLCSNN